MKTAKKHIPGRLLTSADTFYDTRNRQLSTKRGERWPRAPSDSLLLLHKVTYELLIPWNSLQWDDETSKHRRAQKLTNKIVACPKSLDRTRHGSIANNQTSLLEFDWKWWNNFQILFADIRNFFESRNFVQSKIKNSHWASHDKPHELPQLTRFSIHIPPPAICNISAEFRIDSARKICGNGNKVLRVFDSGWF